MTISNDSATYPCPNCGKDVGLVTWKGKPPKCPSCQGQTVIGDGRLGSEDSLFENEEDKRSYERIKELMNDNTEDSGCLHDKLEENKPPNQKGGVHMLSCPCPKCSPRC